MSNNQAKQAESSSLDKSSGFSWGIAFFIFLSALFTPIIGVWGYTFYKNNLEVSKPTIRFVSVPDAIGANTPQIVARIVDEDSGLSAIRVEVFQGNSSFELMTKVFDNIVNEDLLEIPLKYDGVKIKEGPIRVTIGAWDRSRWKNYGQINLDLNVDITPPNVRLITPEIKIEQGGAGMVFFRATDYSPLETGVLIGENSFKGFRAEDLDPVFRSAGDSIYFVWFPVPLDSTNQRRSVQIFARDIGGNVLNVEVPFVISGAQSLHTSVQISEEGLREKALRLGQEAGIDLKGETLTLDMPIDLAVQVLRQSIWLHARDQKNQFASLGIKSIHRRNWSDPFSFTYQKKSTVANFGDDVELLSQGVSLGRREITGILLSLDKNEPVRAGNGGVVAYVGELGQFGKMVVLDHGLDLTTSYCFLSQTSVTVGQKLRGGDILGFPGSSGLGMESSVLIEMRLQTWPINPIYWSDAKWVHFHIDQVILEAKRKLGIE